MSDMRLSCRDVTTHSFKGSEALRNSPAWLVTSRQAEAYRTLVLPLDAR